MEYFRESVRPSAELVLMNFVKYTILRKASPVKYRISGYGSTKKQIL